MRDLPAPTVVSRRPMTIDEFEAFAHEAIQRNASDSVESGKYAAALAQAKSEAEFRSILPDGLDTENHHLFSIEVRGAHEVVATLGEFQTAYLATLGLVW